MWSANRLRLRSAVGSWRRHAARLAGPILITVAACSLTAPSEDEVAGGCPQGRKACGAECVAIGDPRFGCSAETCDPCKLPHAEAACEGDVCVSGTCEPGFSDCNKLPEDGCEAELARDPDNCSDCLNACASGVCNDGGCCKQVGDACSSELECCGRDCQGTCCINNGDTCSSPADCCLGVCTDLRCCRAAGAGCGEDDECCSDKCGSGSCE